EPPTRHRRVENARGGNGVDGGSFAPRKSTGGGTKSDKPAGPTAPPLPRGAFPLSRLITETFPSGWRHLRVWEKRRVRAMKTAIIVLLVLSKGDGQDAAMVAMTRAAERALGADSRIFVHEPQDPLSDDDAVNLGQQMRASAVVEVRWAGP